MTAAQYTKFVKKLSVCVFGRREVLGETRGVRWQVLPSELLHKGVKGSCVRNTSLPNPCTPSLLVGGPADRLLGHLFARVSVADVSAPSSSGLPAWARDPPGLRRRVPAARRGEDRDYWRYRRAPTAAPGAPADFGGSPSGGAAPPTRPHCPAAPGEGRGGPASPPGPFALRMGPPRRVAMLQR